MGRIVLSTNLTLDGVGQDPTGEDGSAFGGWFEQMSDGDREAWARVEFEEALGVEACLLGGRSYEWFAQRWVGRAGAWGERLQSLPKYVVRTSAGRTDWGPTTVLSGEVPDEVSKLKQNLAGDLLVYASFQLAHTLFAHDLVDEVRLIVFPSVAGSGGRLFPELPDRRALRLSTVEPVGAQLVRLCYQLTPAPEGR